MTITAKTPAKRPAKRELKSKAAINKYGFNFLDIEGTFLNVPLSKIDISPLNYRQSYDEKALNDFAQSLKSYGVISPVTLRKMPNGRFELVVGERRYRAAKIAALKSIPAVVKMLTDEQVIEIMLLENLQRENPHPLHEAQAIARMQKNGLSIDEISARLGKSKSFVYARLKWSELILPIQKMFLANVVPVKDVMSLSLLESGTQQEFFDKYCSEWESETFEFSKVRNAISYFKYDLIKACFDTKDKNLIEEAGACTRCPFNSATIKSLFPDLAQKAFCSHKVCYESKCLKHLENELRKALNEHQPDSLLLTNNISQESQMLLDSLPEINALVQLNYYDVHKIYAPETPDKEDYQDYETEELDEQDYNRALQKYETDKEEYLLEINSDNVYKGLTVFNDQVSITYYKTEKEKTTGAITAKEVQQAIKEGTVTVDLLTQEIARIEAREKRAKEIDAENVQKQIHKDFSELVNSEVYDPVLNAMDIIASRLIIFQCMDWYTSNEFCKKVFPGLDLNNYEQLLESLAAMSDNDYCYLIRLVFCKKGGATIPNSIDGNCLYKIAAESGFDVQSIENVFKTKANERQERVDSKIAEVERRIEKMNAKAK